MKKRFSEEQIIGILKEAEAGLKPAGAVPQARHPGSHVLQQEGEVWRHDRFELPLNFRLPAGRVQTRPKGRKAEMFKEPHQVYAAEFKEAAVQRIKDVQGMNAVARELGMSTQTLRNWLKAFEGGS